jgi:hypothetical protein
MFPSTRRLFATSAPALARMKGGPRKSSNDPMDVMLMGSEEFSFELTRPTILKMEKRRTMLHYLRLEQDQFKQLGQSRPAAGLDVRD